MRAASLVSCAAVFDLLLFGPAFIRVGLGVDLLTAVLQTSQINHPSSDLAYRSVSIGALLLCWDVDELYLGIGKYCILCFHGQRTPQER